MLKTAYAVTLASLMTANIAMAGELPTTAMVPEHKWVEVVNPDAKKTWGTILWALRTGRDRQPAGSSCSIDFGDSVTLVGQEGTAVLLKVDPGSNLGARCRKGVLFLLDRNEYKTMSDRYNTNAKQKNEKEAMIFRMMGEK